MNRFPMDYKLKGNETKAMLLLRKARSIYELQLAMSKTSTNLSFRRDVLVEGIGHIKMFFTKNKATSKLHCRTILTGFGGGVKKIKFRICRLLQIQDTLSSGVIYLPNSLNDNTDTGSSVDVVYLANWPIADSLGSLPENPYYNNLPRYDIFENPYIRSTHFPWISKNREFCVSWYRDTVVYNDKKDALKLPLSIFINFDYIRTAAIYGDHLFYVGDIERNIVKVYNVVTKTQVARHELTVGYLVSRFDSNTKKAYAYNRYWSGTKFEFDIKVIEFSEDSLSYSENDHPYYVDSYTVDLPTVYDSATGWGCPFPENTYPSLKIPSTQYFQITGLIPNRLDAAFLPETVTFSKCIFITNSIFVLYGTLELNKGAWNGSNTNLFSTSGIVRLYVYYRGVRKKVYEYSYSGLRYDDLVFISDFVERQEMYQLAFDGKYVIFQFTSMCFNLGSRAAGGSGAGGVEGSVNSVAIASLNPVPDQRWTQSYSTKGFPHRNTLVVDTARVSSDPNDEDYDEYQYMLFNYRNDCAMFPVSPLSAYAVSYVVPMILQAQPYQTITIQTK